MHARCGRWTGWLSAMALVLAGLIALPAAALPVDVFFTGTSISGDPNTNYGVSEADALAANLGFGIQIVDDLSFVGGATGTLEAQNSLAPNWTLRSATENRATSSWTVDNIGSFDLAGATYLLFTHTDPVTIAGELIDYADANVGLTIDAALGWVIVKKEIPALGASFYYPAILLDRSVSDPRNGFLGEGESSAGFGVNYVVNEELLQAPAGSGEFQLPELGVGMGFIATVVPEPSSAALLALGVLALSARRRRAQ